MGCALVLAVLAGLVGCGGSGTSSSSSGAGSSSSGAASSSSGAASASTGAAAAGTGTIKGKPFQAAGAFVQYDPMQKGWWVVLTGPGHACSDVTSAASQLVSAVTPNVNVFFHVSRPHALPATGRRTDMGVTFADATGYPNTLNGPGVSVTLTDASAGHWKGRLQAPAQTLDGASFGFQGSFDAVVCPPASG